jgi:hypothetical protein
MAAPLCIVAKVELVITAEGAESAESRFSDAALPRLSRQVATDKKSNGPIDRSNKPQMNADERNDEVL